MTGPDEDSDDTANFSPAQYLPNPDAGPLEALETKTASDSHNEQLYLALTKLDSRSREIVETRWLSEKKRTFQPDTK